MKDKYDYMQSFNVKSNHNIAKTIAVFSAFTEGLQLFASFAILLNFPRQNKMKGMGQIVTWSVRDETLHCNSMIRLFKEFIRENPEIWTPQLKKELYEACRTIIEHEDKPNYDNIDKKKTLKGYEKLANWKNNGYRIILTSARPEEQRENLEKLLLNKGIV